MEPIRSDQVRCRSLILRSVTDEDAPSARRHWPVGHTATSADGAVFLEDGPVSPMREFHNHALRIFG